MLAAMPRKPPPQDSGIDVVHAPQEPEIAVQVALTFGTLGLA